MNCRGYTAPARCPYIVRKSNVVPLDAVRIFFSVQPTQVNGVIIVHPTGSQLLPLWCAFVPTQNAAMLLLKRLCFFLCCEPFELCHAARPPFFCFHSRSLRAFSRTICLCISNFCFGVIMPLHLPFFCALAQITRGGKFRPLSVCVKSVRQFPCPTLNRCCGCASNAILCKPGKLHQMKGWKRKRV